jgi:hypothetical protein
LISATVADSSGFDSDGTGFDIVPSGAAMSMGICRLGRPVPPALGSRQEVAKREGRNVRLSRPERHPSGAWAARAR